MTAEQFEKATAQERNEAIALELGSTKDTTCSVTVQFWRDPSGGFYGAELPDWQGNNGLAFEELWHYFEDCLYSLSVDYKGTKCIFLNRNGCKCGLEYFAIGDTWAHAMCKAFLALKHETP